MIFRPPKIPTAHYDMEFIPVTVGDFVILVNRSKEGNYEGYRLITPPQFYGEAGKANIRRFLLDLLSIAQAMAVTGDVEREIVVNRERGTIKGLEKITDMELPEAWRIEWVGYKITPDVN